MAKFLTAAEIYRLFQRELPDGAYADGAPSAFFTTASLYSKSQVVAAIYANLERIYLNYWPQTADEKIGDHEIKVFGFRQGGLSLAERQQQVVQKLRHRPTISLWEMLTQVLALVPSGTYVQLAEWGNPFSGDGGWVIGHSKLGLNTRLAHGNGFRYSGAAYTESLGPSRPADLVAAQDSAYTYEVRIFGFVGSATIAQIDALLKKIEPARATHEGRIFDNLSLSDYNLTQTVDSADEFSLVSCACIDALSGTGYTGKRAE